MRRQAWLWAMAVEIYAAGGDHRRVHHECLDGSNVTGTFYFTGWEWQ
jgi:hypothetical protein